MLINKKHLLFLSFFIINVAMQLQAQVTKTTVAKEDSNQTTSPPRIAKEPKNLPTDSSNKMYVDEIEASVNVAEWRLHLQKQLVPYIEKAAAKGMKSGVYTVNVRFLIEKDGSINNVEALNNPGYGLAEGVVKVVATGPKWTPGEQNGKKVRSYHTQPVTFTISNQ